MPRDAEVPTTATRIPVAAGAIELPAMGLGGWAWGDRSTWGMNGYDRDLNLDTIRAAFQRSIDAGITLIDTAEVYGNGESERIIGRLLQEEPHLRQRILLATKFMPYPWRMPFGASLLAALRASLERLRLPAVDLYQIHGPISLRSASTIADALAAAHAAGMVKAVGVSNYNESEVRAIHATLSRHGLALATNQVEYSLLRTRPESTGLIRSCAQLGVAILAYSPIGQGRLTGKYSAANPPPGGRNFSDYPMQEVEPILAELRRLGAKHGGRTPSQVALNWLMCKGCVPIPGAKNGAQAAQNAGALGWRLDAEDVAALDRVAKPGLRRLMHVVWQHG
jgi:aryl-alcohol dehydrogenase-like predicted oxidoreductase